MEWSKEIAEPATDCDILQRKGADRNVIRVVTVKSLTEDNE